MSTTPWQEVTIGDFGMVITGKTPSTKRQEYYGGAYPFITPTDIVDGLHTVRTARFLSEEGRELQERYLLPPKTVCYTCIASIGKICITTEPSFTNQQINSIVVDHERYDYRFVYHLLRHETERIKGLASGAAAPIINKSAFSKIIVVVPPLPTQRKIAAILSAYDDLIENNTRRIQLLEESAQLLYREWFVRFRFPGHERVRMVESDLGLIPEGWDIRTLEQFGSIVTGKTPSKAIPEYYGDYMPFIKIPDMHGRIFCTEAGEYLSLSGVLSQQNKTLPPNSICVSCIGSAGLVAITTAYSQTNQQINSIIVDNDSDREFLYFTLVGLRDTINLYGANGVTMVNLNRSKFANLRTLYPTLTLVTQFHQMTQPLFEQILVLQRTNTLLRTTRDLLLPRLISGEVDVTELEIVI